jgi:hypothetical protein
MATKKAKPFTHPTVFEDDGTISVRRDVFQAATDLARQRAFRRLLAQLLDGREVDVIYKEQNVVDGDSTLDLPRWRALQKVEFLDVLDVDGPTLALVVVDPE